MSDFLNAIDRGKGGDDAPANENVAATDFSGVDMSVLRGFEAAQGAGEPDLIVELIDLYLADVPRQLSAMKDFLRQNDAVSLKRAAHNLKGSSANLGANAVADACERLEQTDLIESPQAANRVVELLEHALARVDAIFSAERRRRA